MGVTEYGIRSCILGDGNGGRGEGWKDGKVIRTTPSGDALWTLGVRGTVSVFGISRRKSYLIIDDQRR